jgi:hypothetical protein
MREQNYIPYPISLEIEASGEDPTAIAVGLQHLLPASLAASPEWEAPDSAPSVRERQASAISKRRQSPRRSN